MNENNYIDKLQEKYLVDIHKIHTSDGYINTTYEIKSQSFEKYDENKIVIMHHGLLDSSDCFMILEEQSNFVE